jgi:hypothetical protein
VVQLPVNSNHNISFLNSLQRPGFIEKMAFDMQDAIPSDFSPSKL